MSGGRNAAVPTSASGADPASDEGTDSSHRRAAQRPEQQRRPAATIRSSASSSQPHNRSHPTSVPLRQLIASAAASTSTVAPSTRPRIRADPVSSSANTDQVSLREAQAAALALHESFMARKQFSDRRRQEQIYHIRGWEDLYGGNRDNQAGPPPSSASQQRQQSRESVGQRVTSSQPQPHTQPRTVPLPAASQPVAAGGSLSSSSRPAAPAMSQVQLGKRKEPPSENVGEAERSSGDDSDDDFEVVDFTGPASKRARITGGDANNDPSPPPLAPKHEPSSTPLRQLSVDDQPPYDPGQSGTNNASPPRPSRSSVPPQSRTSHVQDSAPADVGTVAQILTPGTFGPSTTHSPPRRLTSRDSLIAIVAAQEEASQRARNPTQILSASSTSTSQRPQQAPSLMRRQNPLQSSRRDPPSEASAQEALTTALEAQEALYQGKLSRRDLEQLLKLAFNAVDLRQRVSIPVGRVVLDYFAQLKPEDRHYTQVQELAQQFASRNSNLGAKDLRVLLSRRLPSRLHRQLNVVVKGFSDRIAQRQRLDFSEGTSGVGSSRGEARSTVRSNPTTAAGSNAGRAADRPMDSDNTPATRRAPPLSSDFTALPAPPSSSLQSDQPGAEITPDQAQVASNPDMDPGRKRSPPTFVPRDPSPSADSAPDATPGPTASVHAGASNSVASLDPTLQIETSGALIGSRSVTPQPRPASSEESAPERGSTITPTRFREHTPVSAPAEALDTSPTRREDRDPFASSNLTSIDEDLVRFSSPVSTRTSGECEPTEQTQTGQVMRDAEPLSSSLTESASNLEIDELEDAANVRQHGRGPPVQNDWVEGAEPGEILVIDLAGSEAESGIAETDQVRVAAEAGSAEALQDTNAATGGIALQNSDTARDRPSASFGDGDRAQAASTSSTELGRTVASVRPDAGPAYEVSNADRLALIQTGNDQPMQANASVHAASETAAASERTRATCEASTVSPPASDATTEAAAAARSKRPIRAKVQALLEGLAQATGRDSSFETMQTLRKQRPSEATSRTVSDLVDNWQEPASLVPWECLEILPPSVLHSRADEFLGLSMHELADRVAENPAVVHLDSHYSLLQLTRTVMELPRVPHMLERWHREKINFYKNRQRKPPDFVKPEFRRSVLLPAHEPGSIAKSVVAAAPASSNSNNVSSNDTVLNVQPVVMGVPPRPQMELTPVQLQHLQQQFAMATLPKGVMADLSQQPQSQLVRVGPQVVGMHQHGTSFGQPMAAQSAPLGPLPPAGIEALPVPGSGPSSVSMSMSMSAPIETPRTHTVSDSPTTTTSLSRSKEVSASRLEFAKGLRRKAAEAAFSALAADSLSLAEHVAGTGSDGEIDARDAFTAVEVGKVLEFVIVHYTELASSGGSADGGGGGGEDGFLRSVLPMLEHVKQTAEQTLHLTALLTDVKSCMLSAATANIGWVSTLLSDPHCRPVVLQMFGDPTPPLPLLSSERDRDVSARVQRLSQDLETCLSQLVDFQSSLDSHLLPEDPNCATAALVRREFYLIAKICCKFVVGALGESA